MKTALPGLGALLREYLAARRLSKGVSFVDHLHERNPHVFSHHDCTRADYLDHVWRCRGLHICRGCTAVFVALMLSLALGLVTRWPVVASLPPVAAIFTGLLLLSLVPLPEGPRTAMHDLRRVALGVLLGSATTFLILADDWLPRVVVVAVWIGVVVVRRFVGRRLL